MMGNVDLQMSKTLEKFNFGPDGGTRGKVITKVITIHSEDFQIS